MAVLICRGRPRLRIFHLKRGVFSTAKRRSAVEGGGYPRLAALSVGRRRGNAYLMFGLAHTDAFSLLMLPALLKSRGAR